MHTCKVCQLAKLGSCGWLASPIYLHVICFKLLLFASTLHYISPSLLYTTTPTLLLSLSSLSLSLKQAWSLQLQRLMLTSSFACSSFPLPLQFLVVAIVENLLRNITLKNQLWRNHQWLYHQLLNQLYLFLQLLNLLYQFLQLQFLRLQFHQLYLFLHFHQ